MCVNPHTLKSKHLSLFFSTPTIRVNKTIPSKKLKPRNVHLASTSPLSLFIGFLTDGPKFNAKSKTGSNNLYAHDSSGPGNQRSEV